MARIKKETESPIEEFINEPVEEQDNELVTPAPQVIPDNIDRILKMYPGYEKLYIDSKAGLIQANNQTLTYTKTPIITSKTWQ